MTRSSLTTFYFGNMTKLGSFQKTRSRKSSERMSICEANALALPRGLTQKSQKLVFYRKNIPTCFNSKILSVWNFYSRYVRVSGDLPVAVLWSQACHKSFAPFQRFFVLTGFNKILPNKHTKENLISSSGGIFCWFFWEAQQGKGNQICVIVSSCHCVVCCFCLHTMWI